MRRLSLSIALIVAFASVPILRDWPVAVVRAATATDNFNRMDATTLGANWTNTIDSPDLITNAVDGPGTFVAIAHYNAVTFSANQCSQVTIVSVAAGHAAFVVVRSTDANNRYEFVTNGASGAGNSYINEIAGGVETLIKNITVTFTASDTVKLCVVGTTLSIWKNSAFVDSATNATLATGQPGLGTFGANPRMDDWIGSDAGVPGEMMRGFIGR
jgi:hypothetical protein